jgi:hypothetical protein
MTREVSWAYTPPSGSNACRSWCDHMPPPTLYRGRAACLSAVGSRLIGAVPVGDRPLSQCMWTSLFTTGVPDSQMSPRASIEVLICFALLYGDWWCP